MGNVPMAAQVDYDSVAPHYDRRYSEHDYAGIRADLAKLVQPGTDVLEVGCGTGHWLRYLSSLSATATGVDPSVGMLSLAVHKFDGNLIRASAEQLPFAPASFDCAVVVNAAHHFTSLASFIEQAFDAIRPGGLLAVFGLDPSQPGDEWFIYDYFEPTLALDQARYPTCEEVCSLALTSGFSSCTHHMSHEILNRESGSAFLNRGDSAQQTTSQLRLLSAAEFKSGIRSIQHAQDAAKADGRDLTLEARLRLHCTVARRSD